MSGKTILRNIMGILSPGVNSIITEHKNQIYGQHLEKVVQLSLEIIILVLEKDIVLSDMWRPLYQVFIQTPTYYLFKSRIHTCTQPPSCGSEA